MERLNRTITGKKERPVKVLQFGEGNFLRAFADYMIDIANEKGFFDGDIIIVKPIEFGSLEHFRQQESQYTVQLRGIVEGEAKRINRIVTSIADTVDAYGEYGKYASLACLDSLRFVISNTTEAGIVYDDTDRLEEIPPRSFPGKLTKFLYERYQYFKGDQDKGLIMLPVELIDDNGIRLRECVRKLAELWKLEPGFLEWINEACVFTSTLVDRIVTGYPKDEAEELWQELGYQDELMVTGEPFALWVIESERDISAELPLPAAGLPVVFTDDQKPYRQRKVRILNGAHTSFVPAAYLCGKDIVLEAMEDEVIFAFMKNTIFEEVIPTLALPGEELVEFAQSVITRFQNPYVKHALLSISLNSVSKWRTRCLPSFLDYRKQKGRVPRHLAFSLAALMAFYTGSEIRDGALIGTRSVKAKRMQDGGEAVEAEKYQIRDDPAVLAFFAENSGRDVEAYTYAVLSNTDFWGQDLSLWPDVMDAVSGYLSDIRTLGIREALEKVVAE